jgi:hypothetical protein
MPKPRAVVAAVGALIYAPVGVSILWSSMAGVAGAIRDYSAGSGIGAVSAGVDVMFLSYVLLAMASIVASRMLAPWARQSGGNIAVLHRTQRWSIVLAFAVVFASVVAFNVRIGPVPFLLLPLSGVVWGFQFVLTAALLGVYALRTSRP